MGGIPLVPAAMPPLRSEFVPFVEIYDAPSRLDAINDFIM
jgi:hypothetical protein